MHEKLQEFARGELKRLLNKLPDSQQDLFIRCYSKVPSLDINKVIDSIEDFKLESAMKLVERSIVKFELDNNNLSTRQEINVDKLVNTNYGD